MFSIFRRISSRKNHPLAHVGLPRHDSPGEALSLDDSGPLPVTRSPKKYILLVTDRFSRRAAMYVITIAQLTAVGTTDTLVKDSISNWDCPKSLVFDHGRRCSFELFRPGYKMMRCGS